MDGNNTPGTLDEELDEETRSAQSSLGCGENPGWDHEGGHESRDDDGTATTNKLAEVPNDSTANTGTSLHENRGTRSSRVVELLLLQHEGGVRVLRSVRVVVEPSHEETTVNTHLPLGDEHLLAVCPESTRCGRLLALGAGFKELLGLGEEDTNDTDGN